MAKLIPYDNTGVEESQGGTGVKVKPGVKVARIARATYRELKKDGSEANDIELALNVGDEYDWVFTYIGLGEPSKWKMAEFTRALGMKESGKIDVDKVVGKIIRVKINPDSYMDEYVPRAGRLMKAQEGDEEAFDEGNTAASEISSQNGDGPEAEVDADGDKIYSDPGFTPSREGEEGIDSYDDWPEEDLLAEVEDRGVTLPGGRGSKKNKAIAALREEDAEVSGASAGDKPEGGDDDYDDWDLDQLKEEWTTREMGDLPVIKGRNAEARLMSKLIDELRADDAENPFDA